MDSKFSGNSKLTFHHFEKYWSNWYILNWILVGFQHDSFKRAVYVFVIRFGPSSTLGDIIMHAPAQRNGHYTGHYISLFIHLFLSPLSQSYLLFFQKGLSLHGLLTVKNIRLPTSPPKNWGRLFIFLLVGLK